MNKGNEQTTKATAAQSDAAQAQVKAFVEKSTGLLASLYGRWQDEQEYEDINEYGARIAKEFPENWKLLGTTKRPFGVKVDTGTVKFHITINSRHISWKVTAK